jgi:hypothetical protein
MRRRKTAQTERDAMTDGNSDSARRRNRVLLERLWIAAGLVVLVGFAVIAVGIVIAVLGWCAEKVANRRHLI